MYYLMYYKDEKHLDVNRFNKLSKVVEEAKKCNWADMFEVFADHWKTYKINGTIKDDGDILWESITGKIEGPICKFMNEWIEV